MVITFLFFILLYIYEYIYSRQSFNLFYFIFNLAKMTKDGKLEVCKPIHKVELKTTKTGYV